MQLDKEKKARIARARTYHHPAITSQSFPATQYKSPLQTRLPNYHAATMIPQGVPTAQQKSPFQDRIVQQHLPSYQGYMPAAAAGTPTACGKSSMVNLIHSVVDVSMPPPVRGFTDMEVNNPKITPGLGVTDREFSDFSKV